MTTPKPERLYAWAKWRANGYPFIWAASIGLSYADDGIYPAEAASPIPPELEEAWRKRGELL